MHIINSEKKKIKLGSLFDGIGVVPLAVSRWGIEPVWASEIGKGGCFHYEKTLSSYAAFGRYQKNSRQPCRSGSSSTFGSPCQDLLVAGFQSGLQGKRSGLFFEAIRIIKEMRCATNELYPNISLFGKTLKKGVPRGRFWRRTQRRNII